MYLRLAPAIIALSIFHLSPQAAWHTSDAPTHPQTRATQPTSHPGALVDDQDGQPVLGGKTTDGRWYGQTISIEVFGADGKTSSPTRAPTSSSQNRTLLSLSDLFGVIGRHEGTSILIAITFAGTMVANRFGRTKSLLVCLISNAEILIRSTTFRLGGTVGPMTMSGATLNGPGPNPMNQFGYEERMEELIIMVTETLGTP